MIPSWTALRNWFRSRRDRVRQARALGVRVGDDCRIYDCSFGSEPFLITLGHHVTVSQEVQFVTHDGGVWVFREEHPDLDVFAPIRVGNNVFLGARSIILPGAVIEDHVVIGAGAVVSGRIPSNSVAAGVPARVIKSLDEYRSKVMEHGVRIRGLPRSEKRRILCRTFALPEPTDCCR